MSLCICVCLHGGWLQLLLNTASSQLRVPRSFTAAAERGWSMMVRMCGEELRIIQGHLTGTRMCKSLSPLIHQLCVCLSPVLMKGTQPGQVRMKGPAALQLCPFGFCGTSAPLNICLQQGPPFLVWAGLLAKCLSKSLCGRLGLSPSL